MQIFAAELFAIFSLRHFGVRNFSREGGWAGGKLKLDRREVGQKGGRTGGRQDRRETGQERGRTREADRREAGQQGCITGWMHDRRDERQETLAGIFNQFYITVYLSFEIKSYIASNH